MMRIHTKALALSAGIICGAMVGITTLVGVFFQYGRAWLDLLVSIYPGYSVTLAGSALGTVYGFCDGMIFFGLLGWLYNKVFVRM